MITYQEVLEIHQVLVESFGGVVGVREEGLLRAAIERPFAGFGETEFYQTPAEKAAAIVESIVKNHPFVDGNKRTGYVLMRLLLLQAGQDLQATQDEKYDFVISIASGQIAFPEIVTWIQSKLVSSAR
ncbi:MAG TPA: type II toxin-antitoxin system death-on-curing family toxin [Hymenobacter sp.]|uniref:type II toxin-antitoxin system death-on-curing family toxin n=1 Tax=Hymenobacter sp. TaxID=1898978 RepID=UPI002D805A17|nr:type II toxin-antitoxin system death-on-curing family toxin [Hymenobacter sp.]HET9505043.1 type II toxin-antitoxin system death-on-curing family toxin [Hymenobacter sp.]